MDYLQKHACLTLLMATPLKKASFPTSSNHKKHLQSFRLGWDLMNFHSETSALTHTSTCKRNQTAGPAGAVMMSTLSSPLTTAMCNGREGPSDQEP